MKGAATTTTRNTILRSTILYRESRKENTTQTSGDEKNAKAEKCLIIRFLLTQPKISMERQRVHRKVKV